MRTPVNHQGKKAVSMKHGMVRHTEVLEFLLDAFGRHLARSEPSVPEKQTEKCEEAKRALNLTSALK